MMHFWQEYHRSDDVTFSLHHMWRHMILTCLITVMVIPDHLVKVMFAKLLKYKVTINISPFKVTINISPFVIMYFLGRWASLVAQLDTSYVNSPFSIIFLLINFSIH